MFQELEKINQRPKPFEFYTASELWTDEHTSKHMLAAHLDGEIDLASRRTLFIDRSVEWIVSRFGVSGGTKIADFGCGPGLYTSRLARKGAQVTGIDFSPRSIRYAREQAEKSELSIRYVNENYLEFETEDRFDLVLMIFCDFCALSPAQRKQMLTKFGRLLEPGGHVLLDVCSLAAFEGREERAGYELNLLDGFWSPNKYYGFLNTFKYEEEKVTLDKYTIVEAGRTWTVYNWLGHFSPDDIQREFGESGLTVDAFYGDVAGSAFDPGAAEFAVVASKP
jgi:SAM-dependent methyltransferase